MNRKVSKITLQQGHYVAHILKLAGMVVYNLTYTPMKERLELNQESTAEDVDPTHYQRIVGSLHCLIHTWPDLAFAVRFMSWFMEKPTEEHLQVVKRILPYVIRTLDSDLCYGQQIVDLAGDIDMRKSTSGILFFLGDCLIS
jgi:hypothetical protein